MGDMGDAFNDYKQWKKRRKERLGVECASCKVKLPKAQPKILLPGERCWCGYRDPRKRDDYPDDDPNITVTKR